MERQIDENKQLNDSKQILKEDRYQRMFDQHMGIQKIGQKNESYDRHKIEKPGRKHRSKQYRSFNKFTCGECQSTFTSRFAQTRHLQTYHSDHNQWKRDRLLSKKNHKKWKKFVRQKNRENKLQKEKKPRGRPPHSQHICNICKEEFETASKKRDHQKRCKTVATKTNICKEGRTITSIDSVQRISTFRMQNQ